MSIRLSDRQLVGLKQSVGSKVKGQEIQQVCGQASRCHRGCLSLGCSSHCCLASLPSSAEVPQGVRVTQGRLCHSFVPDVDSF